MAKVYEFSSSTYDTIITRSAFLYMERNGLLERFNVSTLDTLIARAPTLAIDHPELGFDKLRRNGKKPGILIYWNKEDLQETLKEYTGIKIRKIMLEYLLAANSTLQ